MYNETFKHLLTPKICLLVIHVIRILVISKLWSKYNFFFRIETFFCSGPEVDFRSVLQVGWHSGGSRGTRNTPRWNNHSTGSCWPEFWVEGGSRFLLWNQLVPFVEWVIHQSHTFINNFVATINKITTVENFSYLFVLNQVVEVIYWERLAFRLLLLRSQWHSEPCQTYKTGVFAKINYRIVR